MSHSSQFISISQTSRWIYINPTWSASYVFLPEFPSNCYPFWGKTGTWWWESLEKSKTVSRDSHQSLQGTAVEPLHEMELGSWQALSSPLLIFFFFCAGWHSPPPHHPFLEILSNPLHNTRLFGGTELFYPTISTNGSQEFCAATLLKKCKHLKFMHPNCHVLSWWF